MPQLEDGPTETPEQFVLAGHPMMPSGTLYDSSVPSSLLPIGLMPALPIAPTTLGAPAQMRVPQKVEGFSFALLGARPSHILVLQRHSPVRPRPAIRFAQV